MDGSGYSCDIVRWWPDCTGLVAAGLVAAEWTIASSTLSGLLVLVSRGGSDEVLGDSVGLGTGGRASRLANEEPVVGPDPGSSAGAEGTLELLASEAFGRSVEDTARSDGRVKSVCERAAGRTGASVGAVGMVAARPVLAVLRLGLVWDSPRLAAEGGGRRSLSSLFEVPVAGREPEPSRLLDELLTSSGRGRGSRRPSPLRVAVSVWVVGLSRRFVWFKVRPLCRRLYASVMRRLNSSSRVRSMLSRSSPSKRPSS